VVTLTFAISALSSMGGVPKGKLGDVPRSIGGSAVRASALPLGESEAMPVPTFTTSDQAASHAVPAARAHHPHWRK
jgi:hypothetical protein